MKTKLFLLGLIATLSLSGVAQVKTYVKDAVKKTTKSEIVQKQAVNTTLPMRMQLKAVLKADIPEGMTQVTLTAGDVWGDGSGYQMLLDADATAYGTIIPETGGLTTSGDASAATYAEFEYKIPENADGAMTTTNMVFNNSISIMVPAGVYDYCITNPSPGDRIWIASSNGNVPGRGDDFVFEAGYNYVFSLALNGENDAVTLTIPVEGQALTTPENVVADPAVTSAVVAWEDNDDMSWTLRYRPYVDPATVSPMWDFPYPGYEEQLEGWYTYDADGDGYNWSLAYSDDSQTDVCLYSASYADYTGLTPDNWLITPAVGMGGTLKFKSWNRSAYYPDKLAVYVCTNPDWESLDEFEMVADGIQPGTDPEEFEIDLSAYEGMGCIAFRHYDCEDQWAIYLDDIQVVVPGAQELAEWIVVEGVESPFTIEGLEAETTYEVQVQATGVNGASDWTASTLFTTLSESEPTELTAAPTFHGYTEDGIHAYFVEIVETEPSTIYYRVQYNDGEFTEWMEYEEILSFTTDGKYRVEAYAVAPGKLPSYEIAYEFVVSPRTGLDELVSGKTISNVRYFNAAGQEMSEANGLTIVVTTYSDGSTTTSKVVK